MKIVRDVGTEKNEAGNKVAVSVEVSALLEGNREMIEEIIKFFKTKGWRIE